MLFGTHGELAPAMVRVIQLFEKGCGEGIPKWGRPGWKSAKNGAGPAGSLISNTYALTLSVTLSVAFKNFICVMTSSHR